MVNVPACEADNTGSIPVGHPQLLRTFMKAEVTEAEYQIARMLGDVWNLFCQLPKEHPMQDQEFCSAIHKCQDMVLSRAGIRAIKERDLQFCEERKNKE